MVKKLFSYLLLVLSVMLTIVPVSAEASGGTVISTVVPPRYTITFEISGSGSVEYDGIVYKNGDTVQVREGTDMTFHLRADNGYQLKSVSYNGKSVKKQVSDNMLTIENVQQDGTLAVTFAKTGSANSPATGDTNRILLWSMLALGSAAALVAVTFRTRKSKHR